MAVSATSNPAPFAKATLGAMRERSIALTPNNYLVWYTYCSGRDPSLSRYIESIETSGATFDQNRNEEIYDRFFSLDKQGESLAELSEHMAQLVAGLGDDLRSSATGTDSYGKALEQFSDALTHGGDMADLAKAMRKATGTMRSQISSLEQRVSDATDEVTTLREQLRDAQSQALTDHLTGAANRKRFDSELERLTAAADADGGNLSLMMLDLDHFKTFNDTHGHRTGDLVLRLVSKVLHGAAGPRDIVARYGGEEFAIILPASDRITAIAVAEQIRTRLAGSTIKLKNGAKDLGQITVSIGLAEYVAGEPADYLLERADVALYQSKRAGRNRVTTDDESLAA